MENEPYVPRALGMNLTPEGLSSVYSLMSMTGKSFAQITKDAVQKFTERADADVVTEISEDYLERDKVNLTRSSVRLPTELIEAVDKESDRASIDRSTMASFITECYLYDQLVFLQS